jgi:hypothetical protein
MQEPVHHGCGQGDWPGTREGLFVSPFVISTYLSFIPVASNLNSLFTCSIPFWFPSSFYCSTEFTLLLSIFFIVFFLFGSGIPVPWC